MSNVRVILPGEPPTVLDPLVEAKQLLNLACAALADTHYQGLARQIEMFLARD